MNAKDKLLKAYLALRENGEVITATKLCATASVHRSTYYEYFKSIEDVKTYANDEAVKALKSAADEYHYDTEPTETVAHILRSIKAKRELFSLVFGKQPAPEVYDSLYNYLKDNTIGVWVRESRQDAINADMLLTYILSGTLAMLKKWYASGFELDESVMQRLILGVVRYGVYEFIYTE